MISISNLQIRFANAGATGDILNGIDLQINAGESVALMGPNGAGKTTFARCLNGLLIPTAGRVLIDGKDTADAGQLPEIRQQTGMVFQNPENQIVSTTVEREIAFGLENLGTERGRMHAIVEEMLDIFNLEEYRHHPPHLLSGGEMQRLAIAAVMAMSPKVIIFDEPTSLLDPASRLMMMQLIRELHHTSESNPVTSLLITQNPEETLICDRLLILQGGRIVADDRPQVLFDTPETLSKIGLTVPFEYEIGSLLRESGRSFDASKFQRFYAELWSGMREQG